jgi:hypothetical protein
MPRVHFDAVADGQWGFGIMCVDGETAEPTRELWLACWRLALVIVWRV